MPKVKLRRFEWDFIIMLLEDNPGYVSDPLLKEINEQLDRQEY
jgi:hypothetical protein